MRYRRLGRTGFEVSEIGHGLWGMGGWTGSDDARSSGALTESIRLGCNFFDTAWAYGNGKSDTLMGTVARAHLDQELFVASKVPPLNERWPARSVYRYEDVFPRAHVLSHVELIRRALQVETIDLVQFHVWDDSWTDVLDFRSTVEELKTKKLVAAFGLSLNRWEPANGLKAIETGMVDSVQVIYNIFDQSPEDELFPACREHKVGVIARVPLDEGSLAGTLTKSTTFPEGDWRAGYFGPENLPATVDRVEALRKMLPAGMTMPELAFRFILSHPDVSTTIPGMRSVEHVRVNLGYSDAGPLPAELIAALRAHRWDRVPKPWAD